MPPKSPMKAGGKPAAGGKTPVKKAPEPKSSCAPGFFKFLALLIFLADVVQTAYYGYLIFTEGGYQALLDKVGLFTPLYDVSTFGNIMLLDAGLTYLIAFVMFLKLFFMHGVSCFWILVFAFGLTPGAYVARTARRVRLAVLRYDWDQIRLFITTLAPSAHLFADEIIGRFWKRPIFQDANSLRW